MCLRKCFDLRVRKGSINTNISCLKYISNSTSDCSGVSKNIPSEFDFLRNADFNLAIINITKVLTYSQFFFSVCVYNCLAKWRLSSTALSITRLIRPNPP